MYIQPISDLIMKNQVALIAKFGHRMALLAGRVIFALEPVARGLFEIQRHQ